MSERTWRARATAAESEVERLRGRVEELEAQIAEATNALAVVATPTSGDYWGVKALTALAAGGSGGSEGVRDG